MSVYIVANISVQDPSNLAPYQRAAAASMQEFGITLAAKGIPTQMLEGQFDGPLTVVLEAESEQQARAWHASESYQKAIAARSDDAKFSIAIIPRVG